MFAARRLLDPSNAETGQENQSDERRKQRPGPARNAYCAESKLITREGPPPRSSWASGRHWVVYVMFSLTASDGDDQHDNV